MTDCLTLKTYGLRRNVILVAMLHTKIDFLKLWSFLSKELDGSECDKNQVLP